VTFAKKKKKKFSLRLTQQGDVLMCAESKNETLEHGQDKEQTFCKLKTRSYVNMHDFACVIK
jgi:hypothetical protein